MASIRFTRDEVILALDVFYFSGEAQLNDQSKAIQELSELLNVLPIHPVAERGEIFRNPKGVAGQIAKYRRFLEGGRRDRHVGTLFFEIGNEFAQRHDELHAIAEAIRRNALECSEMSFGSENEGNCFPEGALLGHLHRVIEARDAKATGLENRCAICKIETVAIYRDGLNLLEQHLIVPVVELDAKARYGERDFITVCPNCHAALHRYRPWISRENCENLLQ